MNVPAGDPCARFGGMVVYGLYEFDLKTRKVKVLTKYSSAAIPAGVWVQASGTRDSFGNIYFLAFDRKGFCPLWKLHAG